MIDQSRRHFITVCCHGLMAPFAWTWHTSGSVDLRENQTADYLISCDEVNRMNKGKKTDGSKDFQPPYVSLHTSGELKERGQRLWEIMKSCRLCPRECRVNRLEGKKGFCQATSQLQVSSYNAHFGEERPLVGRGGSGTIFLTHCNLRCVFCINWDISHGGQGRCVSVNDLAKMMLSLQNAGCHNINVVTPTHYTPHIILALDRAAEQGLRIPLVWNTCGWERMETLQFLDGIVDIYLPDFKYSDGKMASKFSSGAETYPEICQTALLEMHRQVGTAKPEKNGLMVRGLMIRHLVMPNNVSGTKEVIQWIARNLPKDTYLNIMSQYRPMYRANEFPEISRGISRKEYSDAVKWARKEGLTNLDLQGF
jgi:putative pyruvate formate lyase activating enzyme